MKNDSDVLMTNNIENDLGYTLEGDNSSRRKKTFKIDLSKTVPEIGNRVLNNEISDDLEGWGRKLSSHQTYLTFILD